MGLVRKIVRGDRRAGEQMVTENYPRIFRMLRCLTGSTETAQDLTQQTFTKAWQALGTFQGRAALATWLHKIAYHEYTHWLRDKRDEVSLDDALHIEDMREARGLDSILVSKALSGLSTELRETFVLYYLQEFSVSEVADLLGLPAGTIKSRLHSARQRMRALISAAEAPARDYEIGADPAHLTTAVQTGGSH